MVAIYGTRKHLYVSNGQAVLSQAKGKRMVVRQHGVAELAAFNLLILWAQPPERWDYGNASLCQFNIAICGWLIHSCGSPRCGWLTVACVYEPLKHKLIKMRVNLEVNLMLCAPQRRFSLQQMAVNSELTTHQSAESRRLWKAQDTHVLPSHGG